MEPAHLAFGGGATETVLNPWAAVGGVIACVLILALPRNKVIAPFLVAFFTIPLAQVLVVGGLHFPILRILILVGLVRLTFFQGSSSKGRFAVRFNRVDRVVVLWTLSVLLIGSLRWMEPQAFIKLVGDFLDSIGGYLVLRFLITDRTAVRQTVKVLAAICFIQGACMVSEQFTHQNVFQFLGAASPTIRAGHIRSEGTLGSLYGGVFAGVSAPFFLWLWAEGKSRVTACMGIVGATGMIFASHASTSWLAYGAGFLALTFWPLRNQMRPVRWGLVVMLLALHLIMHGPVWSLIEKIDLTGGSSSYHRYMLVDNTIRHFDQWWLLGYKDPGTWGYDMWDLCNQFVVAAVTGGLVTLILYISIFRWSFAAIGMARKHAVGNRRLEWLVWCLGSALFANVVASFGINYMIQLQVCFFVLLACISVVTFEDLQPVTRITEKEDLVQLAATLQHFS